MRCPACGTTFIGRTIRVIFGQAFARFVCYDTAKHADHMIREWEG